MNEKIKKLCELIENDQAIFITDKYNRRYLTGFTSSAGLIVITKRNSYVLVDSRYFEAAKKAIDFAQVILSSNFHDDAKEILSNNLIKQVYLEYDINFSVLKRFEESLKEVEFIPKNELSINIKEQRTIKTEQELNYIKKAQSIADRSFFELLEHIKPGVTENEVAARLEYIMRLNGSAKASFETIVLFGARTSLPHGRPSESKLSKKDIILIDFGATVNGYRSDMTRTFFIGEATKEQETVYNTVVTAKNMAIAKIKPGEKCSDIDAVARGFIDSGVYKDKFGHGLGHSVGLEIHETPAFSHVSTQALKVGTVMTVEPGIYLEGNFGVRVEDIGVVTNEGFSIFTTASEQLTVL